MASEVVDFEVVLPDKASRARAARSGPKKPMAEVTFALDGGRSCQIVVPVRVGRVLKGQDLGLPRDADEVFDVVRALEGRACFATLTEILSRREHSAAEAREKLGLYGYRECDIDASVNQAEALRFLDDRRYAENFIETRKARGWGRRKIEFELKRAGIDVESLEGYPQAFFSEENDLERARALLAKKPVPSANAYEKLVRHLVSKGFPYRIASDAVRERLDAASQTDESVGAE